MRCSVADDECTAGRLRVGMCERHYRRHLAHGTTASPRVDNLRHYRADPKSGCWLWQGAFWRNGYGKPSKAIHGTRLAHRMMYAEHVGPIPDGMDLDHLCRNRACCNPAHLEAVSRSINLTRGLDARTTCRSGRHDLRQPGALRPGTQQCVECWRLRYRAAGKRYVAKKAAQRASI